MESPIRALGAEHVRRFLDDLAATRHVAVAAQKQALNVLEFLDRDVFHVEIEAFGDVIRARKSWCLPVVRRRNGVHALFAHLHSPTRLVASTLHGSGLPLKEARRLRVEDLRSIQRLPGDKDVRMTIGYSHVLDRGGVVRSPIYLG